MSRTRRWLAASLVALATSGVAARENSGFAPNRIIVKPHDPAAFAAAFGGLRNAFIDRTLKVQEIGGLGAFEVEGAETTADELLKAFSESEPADGAFEYVQKDVLFAGHGSAIPEDPEFTQSAQMWALRAISAPTAWLHGQGSNSVVAAVVDSGIDDEHEDLTANLWRAKSNFTMRIGRDTVACKAGDFGYDAIDGDCRPDDREQHGTNVSGIIGARGDNSIGTVGVNWKVTLLPVAFLDTGNAGSASRAVRALEYLRHMKETGLANIRVVNLSWGAHHRSRIIEDELLRLAELDVVIVTSAGNEAADNDESPVYPAGYDTVSTLISVAATRSDGEIARSSNHGRYSVDIAAPGIGIRTTDPGNSYDSPFGTSMAAAVVTGAVALLASQCPDLTAVQLKRLILNTSDHKPALAPFVVDGRFLNLVAAADKCASIREQRLH
jgi:subtilisin family serine protease